MGIVYKVHLCDIPEINGLGIGSVWKCDCGKLFELVYYPAVTYYHSDSIPSSIGWTPLAPRWFDEATQTPVPSAKRINFTYTPRQTKWEKLRSKLGRK